MIEIQVKYKERMLFSIERIDTGSFNAVGKNEEVDPREWERSCRQPGEGTIIHGTRTLNLELV